MTTGYKLLGYKLADNIFYCLHHREIIALRGTRTQVQLRSTMACLLEYLLAHGRARLVSDEELMINVWEKNNLRPSAQRLWQVIQTLKSRLNQAGVESTLIIRVKCAGYYINPACVTEIYSLKPPGMMNYINTSPADMNKLLVRS
ncbi:winged helix-turn-helix domain-containing protein [Klebsiella quasipneumoniae]|uniref:winged helix-turn-helix domain-containing protein n=1 Tax=Klebsiella quasipneumoniae TaxID=1463165 RepID=UPI002B0595A7|nr:helix-turn-helix domain-containing protein [Klebsiella quasipneumoniae]